MRLVVFPGVLRPPGDTRLLISVMLAAGFASGARVLDLFTGSGVIGIAAARAGADSVTATDISRRAVLNARLNAALNGVRMEVRRGDLFAPVAGERFDLVLANPPYVPSERDRLPAAGVARAWDAGTKGRALLDPLCDSLAEHLTPGGVALIVHSSIAGEALTRERLGARGLETEVLARRDGALGPVVSARAAMLESRGLLEAGRRREELVVIGAGRP